MNDDITTGFEEFDEDQERIEFAKRLGAYALDILIYIVVGGILGAVLGATLTGLFFPDLNNLTEFEGIDGEALEAAQALGGGIMGMFSGFLGSIAGMYLMIIVMFFIEGITGQSLGKMILKIQNKNEDGTKASASTLWIRVLLKYSGTILGITSAITGIAILASLGNIAGLAIFIGCFFVLGEKRQAFHDMIAKTAVFNK